MFIEPVHVFQRLLQVWPRPSNSFKEESVDYRGGIILQATFLSCRLTNSVKAAEA